MRKNARKPPPGKPSGALLQGQSGLSRAIVLTPQAPPTVTAPLTIPHAGLEAA